MEQEIERVKEEADRMDMSAYSALDEERRHEISGLARERTIEEVTHQIQAEEAKLVHIRADNPNAIIEYENRAREIAKLQAQQNSQERDMAEITEKIKELRDQWEPQLDDLVEKINEAFSFNFQQINCAGEVEVAELRVTLGEVHHVVEVARLR